MARRRGESSARAIEPSEAVPGEPLIEDQRHRTGVQHERHHPCPGPADAVRRRTCLHRPRSPRRSPREDVFYPYNFCEKTQTPKHFDVYAGQPDLFDVRVFLTCLGRPKHPNSTTASRRRGTGDMDPLHPPRDMPFSSTLELDCRHPPLRPGHRRSPLLRDMVFDLLAIQLRDMAA